MTSRWRTGRAWKSTTARSGRGVWLDRGELDKIIERSGQTGGSVREAPETYRGDEDRQPYRGDEHPYYGKKKKSFLGTMFGFD